MAKNGFQILGDFLGDAINKGFEATGSGSSSSSSEPEGTEHWKETFGMTHAEDAKKQLSAAEVFYKQCVDDGYDKNNKYMRGLQNEIRNLGREIKENEKKNK